MFPESSFVMSWMGATFRGMRAVPVPLREDFSFDADAFIARMKTENPALVFIAWPNNPTGLLYPEEDLVKTIKACKGLVVIDEAYHAFAGKSFLPRLAEFENLIVIRTVSKLGLAGIRLGYLVGRPAWVAQLDKVRPPYNVSVLTQAAALFLLERLEVPEAQAPRTTPSRTSASRSARPSPRRSATRPGCAASATPTCRSTRRCRAWWSISPAGRGSSTTSSSRAP